MFLSGNCSEDGAESESQPAESEELAVQFPPSVAPTPQAGPRSTFRLCFTVHVLPELDERSETTIDEYLSMFKRWEELTTNPPACDINRVTAKDFRKALVDAPYFKGLSKVKRYRTASTVNKIMRTFAAAISPLWPADRHNPGGLGYIPFFKLPEALQRQKKLPFTFTRKQLSGLYLACSECVALGGYRRSWLYDAQLWRCALVLAINVGPRTWDFFKLKWEDIRWDDYKYGSVWYTSKKTGKVQRVPLNRVARKHLDHLRSLDIDAVRVFPCFGKNKSFYAAWKRICAKAGVNAPFEAFRKTCSTLHNDMFPGAGAFITGHEVKGVNAQSYDNPTSRVIKAVYRLRLPVEFRRGAKLLALAK